MAVPVALEDRGEVGLAAGTSLTLAGPVDLAGREIAIAGAGLLAIDGDLVMGGGRLVVNGERPVRLGDGAVAALDGTLELRLPGWDASLLYTTGVVTVRAAP